MVQDKLSISVVHTLHNTDYYGRRITKTKQNSIQTHKVGVFHSLVVSVVFTADDLQSQYIGTNVNLSYLSID